MAYIGSQDQLLSTIKGNKVIKRFGKLENRYGDQVYINAGGSRAENLKRMEELASLFSFMSDFKIIN